MALAADRGHRFGSGDKRFTVAKPLQLHQALPRFLNAGDVLQGGVVVHNETGKAGSATVKLVTDKHLTVAGARERTVAVGKAPHWSMASSDGRTAYVTNEGSNDVSVVDLTSRTVIATIAVGNAPRKIAVQPGATPHEVAEGLPRLVALERLPRDRADLGVAGGRDGLDQRLLRREVAVDGPDPHPRAGSHVVHLSVQSVLSEGLPGGGEHALAVAARVGSEGA